MYSAAAAAQLGKAFDRTQLPTGTITCMDDLKDFSQETARRLRIQQKELQELSQYSPRLVTNQASFNVKLGKQVEEMGCVVGVGKQMKPTRQLDVSKKSPKLKAASNGQTMSRMNIQKSADDHAEKYQSKGAAVKATINDHSSPRIVQ